MEDSLSGLSVSGSSESENLVGDDFIPKAAVKNWWSKLLSILVRFLVGIYQIQDPARS